MVRSGARARRATRLCQGSAHRLSRAQQRRRRIESDDLYSTASGGMHMSGGGGGGYALGLAAAGWGRAIADSAQCACNAEPHASARASQRACDRAAGVQPAPGVAAKATWWPCCGAAGCTAAAALAAPSSALPLLPRSRTPRSLAKTMESTRGSRREVLAGGTQPTLRGRRGARSAQRPIFRNAAARAAAPRAAPVDACGRHLRCCWVLRGLGTGAHALRVLRSVPPVYTCTVIARPPVRSLLPASRDGR